MQANSLRTQGTHEAPSSVDTQLTSIDMGGGASAAENRPSPSLGWQGGVGERHVSTMQALPAIQSSAQRDVWSRHAPSCTLPDAVEHHRMARLVGSSQRAACHGT